MDAMIPPIHRLAVVSWLAVVVVLVACNGGSEPAGPEETVAVGTTTQPATTLVPARTVTPVPTSAPIAIFVPATEPAPTNTPAPTHPPTATPVALLTPTSTPAPAHSVESAGVSGDCTGDRGALVPLYNVTDGDNGKERENWLSNR